MRKYWKRFVTVSVSALLMLCMISFTACNKGGGDSGGGGDTVPTFSENAATYDVHTGGDYTFKADLKGGTLDALWIGSDKLTKNDYEYNAETGVITVEEITMILLDLDETYTFKLVTDKGEGTFTVKIITTSNITMNTAAVSFDYNAPADIVKDADFEDDAVSSVIVGTADAIPNNMYSYDSAAKKFTIKKEFLSTIFGKKNITVTLSGGDKFAFEFNSNLLYKEDFSGEASAKVTTPGRDAFFGSMVTNGKDDNAGWGVIAPDYEHLFVFGYHTWGVFGGTDMRAAASYTMEFDVKPMPDSAVKKLTVSLNENSDQDPRNTEKIKSVTVDFSGGRQAALAETQGDREFGKVTYNVNTGVAHVRVNFTLDEAKGNGAILYACGGTSYDDNQIKLNNTKWLFDNIVITRGGDANTSTLPAGTLFSESFDTPELTAYQMNPFWGPDLKVENGWLRFQAVQAKAGHTFLFGKVSANEHGNQDSVGVYGDVAFENGKSYEVSFKLKPGDTQGAMKTIRLVLQTTNPGADPRWAHAGSLYQVGIQFVDGQNTLTYYRQDDKTNDGKFFAYTLTEGIADIKLSFTVPSDDKDYNLYGGMCNGSAEMDWLFDDIVIKEVA